MENKEVEQKLIRLYSKANYGGCYDDCTRTMNYINQLEKENTEALMVANCISVNHKHLTNLRKENAELKQQLAAKDKALDKACGKLEYEYTHSDRGRCPNVDYGFIPKYCNKDFCNDSNKECWKEWTEHE